MVCLYFTISGQGSLARCLSLTAQAMLLNGLALGPLNFVTLQAFRVLFASVLSQWLCPLPWPCLFISPCCTYTRVHQIPINSRAAQSGTWRACSDATSWSLKTFELVPELLLSQPNCSKLCQPGAQKASGEGSTWNFCVILNFLQFYFTFHKQSLPHAYNC